MNIFFLLKNRSKMSKTLSYKCLLYNSPLILLLWELHFVFPILVMYELKPLVSKISIHNSSFEFILFYTPSFTQLIYKNSIAWRFILKIIVKFISVSAKR